MQYQTGQSIPEETRLAWDTHPHQVCAVPQPLLALLAFLGPQGAAVSTLWGQEQCQLLSLISWCTSHASNHHLSILYIHGTVW